MPTWAEWRYTLRALLRSKWFTAASVLALAIGIGTNTIFITYLNGVYLPVLPYRDAGSLVEIQSVHPGHMAGPTQSESMLAIRQRVTSLASIGEYTFEGFDVRIGSDPQSLPTVALGGNVFSLLGIAPIAGRWILESDAHAGAAGVVVVAETLAVNHFGSAQGALGKVIRMDSTLREIIGVMPAPFDYPGVHAAWIPRTGPAPTGRSVYAMARLAPNTDLRRANSELATVANALRVADPKNNRGLLIFADPVGHYVDHQRSFISGWAPKLATYTSVFLLAILNVMCLLFARNVAKAPEMAMRTALGASRWQIARLTFIESSWLAAIGTALALAVTYDSLDLMRQRSIGLGSRFSAEISWRVLGATVILAILVVLLCGLWPAIKASSANLHQLIRSDSATTTHDRRQHDAQDILILVQVAATLTILLVSSLYVERLLRDATRGLGYDHRSVISARMPFSRAASDTNTAHTPALRDAYLARVRDLPGVESAAASQLTQLHYDSTIVVVGSGVIYRDVSFGGAPSIGYVSPTYFSTLRIPLKHGRLLTSDDDAQAAPVAVIDERTANVLFSGADPLGQRIRLPHAGVDGDVTIVGVVGNVRYTALMFGDDGAPVVYTSAGQHQPTNLTILVRTKSDPHLSLAGIQRALQSEVPDRTISVDALVDRFRGQLDALKEPVYTYGATAAFGLLMSAIGIYALVAVGVTRRTKEIGIRMALGASRASILTTLLSRTAMLTAIGIALGTASGLALTRVLHANMVGLPALGPIPIVLSAIVVMAVALLACAGPARRAMAVDPMESIRST